MSEALGKVQAEATKLWGATALQFLSECLLQSAESHPEIKTLAPPQSAAAIATIDAQNY